MKTIPPTLAIRFEQLEPGDVFLFLEGQQNVYALKTAKTADRDQNEMVLLGPTFLQESAESYLLPWQPATVLSFGKACSILLPTDPAAWSTVGPSPIPVCLAVSGDKTYLCTNGAESPRRYFPCFVDTSTGEVIERRLPGTAVYTNTWELAILGANHPPRTILKYPLDLRATPQGAE